MKLYLANALTLCAILVFTTGCDSEFMGGGAGALGKGGQPFRSGDGNPDSRNSGNQFGDYGPDSPFGDPNDPNNPNNPNNPGGGDPNDPNNPGGGPLSGGSGGDETIFSDATVTVLRADGSKTGKYNHKDVTMKLSANGKTTNEVAIGAKGIVVTLEKVCTIGKPVQFDLTIHHKGLTIKPNKNIAGGILAHRTAKNSIMIGYEYAALGLGGKEAAADNNDDLIFTITCNGDPQTGEEAEINLGSNVCFDTRISVAAWLSPSQSHFLTPYRACNGT